MKTVAIVPAAGLGIRMAGGKSAQGTEPPKQLLELDGVPILLWTLRRLASSSRLERIIVAVRSGDRGHVERLLAGEDYRKRIKLTEGGESRQDSVANALKEIGSEVELVLVHDAVRPFVEPAQIDKVLDTAAAEGAAILGLPATDTVKQVDPAGGGRASRITATLPRERIVLAQTPQAFRADVLREAFAKATAEGFHGSDEAMLVEHSGHAVAVVLGSPRNIKITRPDDIDMARHLLHSAREG